MAKVLRGNPDSLFAAAKRESGKYPLATWRDGQVRDAKKGTDFTCTRESFVAYMHIHAKKHGLKVRTRMVGSNKVRFQFFQPTLAQVPVPPLTPAALNHSDLAALTQ